MSIMFSKKTRKRTCPKQRAFGIRCNFIFFMVMVPSLLLNHHSRLPRTVCNLQAYRFLIPSVSCSIGIAVGLLAAKREVFFSQVPKQTVGLTQPVFIPSLPGLSSPRIKLATYLSLVPRLRKHGVISPLWLHDVGFHNAQGQLYFTSISGGSISKLKMCQVFTSVTFSA